MDRELIQKSIDYIEDNLKADITAEELSGMIGFSLYHFYRLFLSAVGMPVMQYVLRRRLLNAIYEISCGNKMIDVALEYGFETHAGFYKAYHICEFAEIMARCRTTYEPKEQKPSEKQKPEKQKPDTGLELQTSFGTTEKVQLTVNMYADNNGLFVGLTTEEDGCQEPYCNVTVNLLENVPAYCAFVDTNNMPELEGFLVKNKIAEFTGLTHQSGFCTFPLYSFSPERLRELCPDGTAAYEQTNRIDKKRQKAASR